MQNVAALQPTAQATTQYGTRLICAVIGSVAPDLDVLPKPYGEDAAGLAYMLLHRGATHTVLGGAVLAALIAGVGSLPFRARRGRAFLELLGITALACLLHVVMDFTNDYGVHPFSPFYDRWFYGDFIFLIEPLLWFCLLPLAIAPLFRDFGSRRVNLAVAFGLVALAVGSLAFVWVRVAQDKWLTLPPALFLTAWWAAQLFAYGRWRWPWLGWTSVLAVWAVFFSAARLTKSEVAQLLQRHAPGEHLIEVATTPAPSNPLCFRVITASFHPDEGEIRTRLGTHSLWPSLVSPARCFTGTRSAPPTARLSKSDLEDSPGWHWSGIFGGKRDTFEEYAQSCERVRMTKSFLRAPFWAEQGEHGVVIGDLRLDYELDLAKYCKFLYRKDPERNDCAGTDPEVTLISPFFSSPALSTQVAVTASGAESLAASGAKPVSAPASEGAAERGAR